VPVESSAGHLRAIGRRSIETNNRVGGLVALQGIGRGRKRPSIGNARQPNKPINANWQAAFLLIWSSLRSFQNCGIRCAPCQSRYRQALACLVIN